MENQEPEVDLNQLMQIRRDKLNKLKEEGKDPFEITKFNRTHTSKQIVENYDELEAMAWAIKDACTAYSIQKLCNM